MKERYLVLRFADKMLALMQERYTDFKGFRYDYNASALLMAIVAIIKLAKTIANAKGEAQATVPTELMETYFSLRDCDFYDYHTFVELENKFTYTRESGEKVKLPLILKLEPEGNNLVAVINEDFYQLVKASELDVDAEVQEIFAKCIERLK